MRRWRLPSKASCPASLPPLGLLADVLVPLDLLAINRADSRQDRRPCRTSQQKRRPRRTDCESSTVKRRVAHESLTMLTAAGIPAPHGIPISQGRRVGSRQTVRAILPVRNSALKGPGPSVWRSVLTLVGSGPAVDCPVGPSDGERRQVSEDDGLQLRPTLCYSPSVLAEEWHPVGVGSGGVGTVSSGVALLPRPLWLNANAASCVVMLPAPGSGTTGDIRLRHGLSPAVAGAGHFPDLLARLFECCKIALLWTLQPPVDEFLCVSGARGSTLMRSDRARGDVTA